MGLKIRRAYGTANCVGKTVSQLRKRQGMKQKDLLAKLQALGIEIGESGLSQLEGQFRTVNDKELRALAEIFAVPIEELYNRE